MSDIAIWMIVTIAILFVAVLHWALDDRDGWDLALVVVASIFLLAVAWIATT